MTPHREDLFDYKNLVTSIEVTIADGKKIRVVGTGSVRLTGINGKRIRMLDVLLIPGLDRRLLSVGKLAERGLNVEFERTSCIIWNINQATASGKKVGKAYILECQQETARYVEYSDVDSNYDLWHARMGHLNKDALEKTQRVTTGIPITNFKTKALSSGCLKGKQTVTQFPSHSQTKTSRVLELVHTDLMGPMKTRSIGGAKYVLNFVDDYSKYVVENFLKKKSEVPRRFESFKTMYENQWGERIKCLRSDNGTEFVNKAMDTFCQRNGIVHQKTVPYSPQQNGVAERMNRTIMEKARSMMHYKGVSTSWWAEAVSTLVYLINRTTNSKHTDATPYAIGFKMKPRLDHLRVFGSIGYAHVDDAKRTKLEPKKYKCMFLGYGDNTKGYRVYDLELNKVKMSRSVKLDEREVNGIYRTSMTEKTEVINVIEDIDEVAQPENEKESPVEDEPMESTADPFEDVEMQEDEHEPMSSGRELTTYHRVHESTANGDMVFRPERERSRPTMILTMTIISIRRHPNDLVLIKLTYLQKLY
ncbi:unnamed protein product [Peronospora farinosa]|uniref:Integrase catalytic domain-containing protein n=1 Tax=Peronospora farinosa TaxID=134698 RepID=A0AAV0TRD5_9STRA|nr:unnamed protein product [Peronospora farinosa]